MPSIRTFCLRTADTKLLRGFFSRYDIDFGPDDLPPDADAKSISDRVSDELRLRGVRARHPIEEALARLDKLASEFGEAALDEKTLTEDLADLPSRYARALHVFLHDAEGFRRAEEMVFNDIRRGGKQWTAFGAEQNLISHGTQKPSNG